MLEEVEGQLYAPRPELERVGAASVKGTSGERSW